MNQIEKLFKLWNDEHADAPSIQKLYCTFNHIQRVFATFYYLRYNLDNRRNLNEYTKILGRIRVKR